MTVNPGPSYHKLNDVSALQQAAVGLPEANGLPSTSGSFRLLSVDRSDSSHPVAILQSPTTFLQQAFSALDDADLGSPKLKVRMHHERSEKMHPILLEDSINHAAPIHTDSEGDDDWQPGGSSTETNDDSSDGFDHRHMFMRTSTTTTGGDDELPSSHLEALDGHEVAEDEYDYEDDMDDMEDGLLDSPHNYLPIGYCTNCTATLYTDTCRSCNHASSSDQTLFDAGRATTTQSPASTSLSQSSTIIVWDERMLLHDEGKRQPHPERPDRLRAVMARLQASGLIDRCHQVPCREATREELVAVHTTELLEELEAASSRCGSDPQLQGRPLYLQSDTYANQHTFTCAKLAAGGCAEAAVRVVKGEARFGAAIVRPPGHHAESGTAMGFCFLNNAAVAARAAQAAGAKRVVVLDWDVHHGNGTQHIFETDPNVLYISIHRYDRGMFYPGTGGADEVGIGAGRGFTVNVPWNHAEVEDADYMAAFTQVLLPVTYEFKPDLILISAGFDAAKDDPIGGCNVTPECFGHMTALVKGIAPLVVLLEGGYNLTSTAASTEACLKVILGEEPPPLPGHMAPSAMARATIMEVLQQQAQFWSSLMWSKVGQVGAMPHLPPHTELVRRLYPHDAHDGDDVDGVAEALVVRGEEKRAARRLVRSSALSAAAGVAGGLTRVRAQRRGLVMSRKMQVMKAIHNSAVRALRRRLQKGVGK